MSNIEVGSKWNPLVDEPWDTAVYMDEQVTVTDVDTRNGLLTFKGGRDVLYSGDDTGNIVDNVNSPSHYGQGKIEAIEYISDFLTPEEYQGFLRGNIAKYLHRFPYKNGIEDLKKAQWYLERLIQEVE